MKHTLTAALLLLWGGPVALRAQGPGGGGQPRPVLKALDTNGDGALSATEIAAASRSLLVLDRNGDGQITFDEVSVRPETAGASADQLVTQLMSFDRNGDGVLTVNEVPARMQHLFTRGDANHDGKLTPDEIHAMAARQGMPSGGADASKHAVEMFRNDPLLSALDLNHDGVLSADEIAAAPQSLLVLDRDHDGMLAANEIRPHQQTPEERVNHLLGEWDTNGDGKISKAEAPDRMQANFAAIDTNSDGYLDRAELVEYFRTTGAGGRGGGPRGDAPANHAAGPQGAAKEQ